MHLGVTEQAVLEAYRREAEQLGRRKPLILARAELAQRTGLSPKSCDNARAGLIEKGLLRKMGFTRPMRIELL